MRGFAALWVALFHIASIGEIELAPYLDRFGLLISNGWQGVDIFFVLSVFTLMHTHAEQFSRLTFREPLRFYANRIARVYPLATVSLILIALLLTLYPAHGANLTQTDPHSLNVHSFLRTLAISTRWYQMRWGWNEPIWSLSAEIIGYTFFPIMALCIMRKVSPTLVAVLAISSVMVYFAYQLYIDRVGQSVLVFPGCNYRIAAFFVFGIVLRRLADFPGV